MTMTGMPPKPPHAKASVLLVAALVIITTMIWFALRPETEERGFWAMPAAGNAPEHDIADVAAPGGEPTRHLNLTRNEPTSVSAEETETPRRLGVRSSAGLPVRSLEYRTGAGTWQAAPRSGEVFVLPGTSTELEVRAPGHRPAVVGLTATGSELEPDALFELDLRTLRDRTPSVHVGHGYGFGDAIERRLERSCVWSLEGNGWFRLAASVAQAATELPGSELGIRFDVGEHVSIIARVQLEPGLRARGAIDHLPFLGEGAPFDVLVRDGGRPVDAIEEKTLTVWVAEPGALRDERRFSWGTLVVQQNEVAWEGPLAQGTTRTTSLPLGLSYLASVTDRATGAAGVTAFVHRGAPVTVDLLGGVTVTGTFHAAEPALPSAARAGWRWSRQNENEEHAWLNGSGEFDIEEDGGFALTLPRKGFPGRPPLELRPPAEVRLELDVPGFVTAVVTADVLGRLSVDVGLVELVRRRPDFVLRRPPFDLEHGLPWSPVELSDMSVPGSYEVGATRLDGNRCEVYLSREEGDSTAGAAPLFRRMEGGRRFPLPLAALAPPALVVHGRAPESEGVVAVPFRLVAQGPPAEYEPVASQVWSQLLVTRPVAGAAEIALGWEWADVFVALKRVRDPATAEREQNLQFSAPAGATLWWTLESIDGVLTWPPVARWPLDEIDGPVRIP
jgi:hypothetical protein